MKRILNIDLAMVASQWFAKRWFMTFLLDWYIYLYKFYLVCALVTHVTL